jgi:hypothetical protein
MKEELFRLLSLPSEEREIVMLRRLLAKPAAEGEPEIKPPRYIYPEPKK